jgi:uncharacterized protein (TIGR02266 family)
MTYPGATAAAESRALLGKALEALQQEANLPPDVLSVTENIARAVGALFEAERASSEVDGKASVKHAMGSLSQTMALLQDVKGDHHGIAVATQTLAQVMGKLFPLSQSPTHRPSAPSVAHAATIASIPPNRVPSGPPQAQKDRLSTPLASGPREKLEANVGATTESNFYVGFSGDISEGGVFVATYLTLELGALVDVLVTLPGGFESSIPGIVRFVRDPMDMESEPGIGVRFEKLTAEQRELILRFIRKRPPMFYDD